MTKAGKAIYNRGEGRHPIDTKEAGAMERMRQTMRRIFIRPIRQTLLIAPACFVFLIWVLTHETLPFVDHLA